MPSRSWGKPKKEGSAPVADASTNAGDAVAHTIDDAAHEAAGAGNGALDLAVEPVVVRSHALGTAIRAVCDRRIEAVRWQSGVASKISRCLGLTSSVASAQL